MVCELRMGHPGNKSIADTFLGTRWTAALPLWLPIGQELPEECIAACLWKAAATTSSSLIAAQSGDCFESEEKGDGARMQKEAHNSGFLSSAAFSPSLSLPASLSSSPLFSLLPSLLSVLTVSHAICVFLVCSTFMIGRGWEPEAAIQASLALLKMSHVSLSQD